MKHRVVLVGFGVVGQSVAEILVRKGEDLRARHGLECEVVAICDRRWGTVYDARGLELSARLGEVAAGRPFSDDRGWDAATTIAEADATAMFETSYTDLETGEPATSYCRAALAKGMHVVTSNKGPPALALRQLREEADRHGVRFRFEGAVLSGTPLFNLAESCLAGNEIAAVSGILNGTCNYILCEMEAGTSYEAALRQAQEKGYAESEPDADVNGTDALAKVVILANTLMDGALTPAEVPCKGITAITPEDIARAKAEGRRYKLIGSVTRQDGAIHGRVEPRAIPLSDPLAGVSGAMNALSIKTDLLGEITIAGPGAGPTPTGYALLIDLMRIGTRPSVGR